MKSKTFTSTNLIQKLINHYGLPVFLFEDPEALGDELNFSISNDSKKKHFQLVPYKFYNSLFSYENLTKKVFLFEDLWHTHEKIIASKISWFANLHEKIDGRKCTVVKINESDAARFLNQFHLMNYAKAKYHYALIHEKQIYAVASFSHGRKMNRLPEGKLGYELVRFATIPNVSITGGLSKLISKFAGEHEPGDIMTYVDTLTGEITGLTKLGFVKNENTKPILLHVNMSTHERIHANKIKDTTILDFYNLGNVKLVKTF